MENITKALLIAGAILILIMLLSAVMVFWDDLAIYFSANSDSKILQQLVEENKKFSNYEQKTIRGNELVSVMNRIINYNNYQSEIVGFDRVTIEIDFKGHEDELKYNGETGSNTIITGDISNATDDDEIKRVSETSSRLTSEASANISGITDVKLQKLSSEIANIVDEPKRSYYDSNKQYKSALDSYKLTRAQKLTKILGFNIEQDDNVENIIKATYQYYQYTQFKRAMFKCTSIGYNEKNGRVNMMKFEVVLENSSAGGKQIKFD